ncbi:TRADD-N-associated membrane domain-containing protein [Calothrix sp. CCY 0018]|uniref:TRADD-N-associated membrane domain-containing protein n=1 Tax=Calothrix sp. CCY 0018 TaxID=3103864 RepID=UPI0039C6245A
MNIDKTYKVERRSTSKNNWLFFRLLKRLRLSNSANVFPMTGDRPLVERDIIIKERVRQARLSFNLTLTVILLNTLVTVVGVGLLFSGNLPEGTIITVVGLTSNVVADSRRLDRDTSESLEKLMRRSQLED